PAAARLPDRLPLRPRAARCGRADRGRARWRLCLRRVRRLPADLGARRAALLRLARHARCRRSPRRRIRDRSGLTGATEPVVLLRYSGRARRRPADPMRRARSTAAVLAALALPAAAAAQRPASWVPSPAAGVPQASITQLGKLAWFVDGGQLHVFSAATRR